MGWQSQAVIAEQVIIEGSSGELLIYSGTPAAGNLIGDIIAAGGTDQYGNATYGGFASIDPGTGLVTEIFGGKLFVFSQSLAGLGTFKFDTRTLGVLIDAAGKPVTITGSQVTLPELLAITAAGAPLLQVTETGGSPAGAPTQFIANTASDSVLGIEVSGDTNNRLKITAGPNGSIPAISEGPGNAGQDIAYGRIAANLFAFLLTDVSIRTVGRGLRVAEGSNAKQGTATLSSGTKLVSNTSVTANSRIFLTAQDNNSTGSLRVSARTAGTSFTITSSNAADSGVVAYEIIEPG